MSNVGLVSGDPMVGLAVLMIENADRLNDLEQKKLDDARRAMERASAAEVEALHDAADAVAMGAVVQGALTVAGGAISGIAMYNGATATLKTDAGTGPLSVNADIANGVGNTFNHLAEPMGKLAGDVPRLHADAEAARARQEHQSASMDAEDARSRAHREEQQAGAVLDRVGQILDTEAQGNLSILGNF